MSNTAYYYDLCCKHKGKMVVLYDKNGREYKGEIMYVDRTHVWLKEPASTGGFGYGYYSGNYGGYYGGYYGGQNWFPVALAGLGGFALAAAFFW